MGYFHVAPAFPKSLTAFRRKAMLQQPTHPLAHAAPGTELARRDHPGSWRKGGRMPWAWLSTETVISCCCQSWAWEKASQKQLQPPHPISFWPAHDSVAERQMCSKKQPPNVILSIFLQHNCTREIKKYASVLIHLMQWFLDSFWKGCFLSKIN